MICYLYGKKEFLYEIERGVSSPRFSDLSHYARLENELMKAEETTKNYFIEKSNANLIINGHKIQNNDLSRDPMIGIKPRHCFCLCLSTKKNSPELFERFNANYCLAINIEKLISLLRAVFDSQVKQLKILSSKIYYYNKYEELWRVSNEQAVFYKPDSFSVESEYRIAIFYPLNKSGFNLIDGSIFPFQLENESTHLQCFSDEKVKPWKSIVEGSYEYFS